MMCFSNQLYKMPQPFLGLCSPEAQAIEVGTLVWIVNSFNIGEGGDLLGPNLPGSRALAAAAMWYGYNIMLRNIGIPMAANASNATL
jgi:hypothetical protein